MSIVRLPTCPMCKWMMMRQVRICVREQATQATAQLFPQLPQQASQMSLHFWLSPDGRAAGELLNAIVFSVGMLVFSTIGGALGARIFTTRTGAFKSS